MKRGKLLQIVNKEDTTVDTMSENVPKLFLKQTWIKRMIIGICIVLVTVIMITISISRKAQKAFIEKTYSSVNDIPIVNVGNNYSTGPASGPVELMEINQTFYFSALTRWVGNDQTKQTVHYYTLFRYNLKDGSCTSVSDEVQYIYFKAGEFVYARSESYLTRDNIWNVQYYTNNQYWNNEKKISGQKAKELITDQTKNATIQGKTSKYMADIKDGNIVIKLTGSKKVYTISPILSDIITESTGYIGANQIIGIADGKVYFTVSYNKTLDDYRTEIFSIKLNGTELNLITSGKTKHVIGMTSYIGEDQNLYYSSNEGTTSNIIKFNPTTNESKVIASVKGFVWSWVSSKKYVLCSIALDESDSGSRVEAVPIK